ncbi:hypothetical protein SAMN06295888_101290 [Desulfonatronum zhilinae]|nr:hypothetical protein SAMN06295888_101290 [Desulfonatronum zhilinae]
MQNAGRNRVDIAFTELLLYTVDGQFDDTAQNKTNLRRMCMFRQICILFKLHEYQLVISGLG